MLLSAEVEKVDVAYYLVAPFALLLLAIAVLPLVAGHWWEHNKNKAIVAAILGIPILIWGLMNCPIRMEHSGLEYVSFMCLLGSLFAISGGLFLDGDLRATPKTNALFLLVGGLLANVVGTTGAAMVLIRPLIRTNSQRKHVTHTVVFFIFVVCNVGGCLTPLGDPPLFLGYLRGVPFEWTLRLLPEWSFMLAALIAIYYVWDSIKIKDETREAMRLDQTQLQPLKLSGGMNILLLLGIVAVAALNVPTPWRELAMVGLAVVSLIITPKIVREKNQFGWGPIIEVAVLFVGIFVTMVPALALLETHGKGMGVESPMQFFWFAGILSSFLDNAPTYLTFLQLAQSLDLPEEVVGVSHAVLTGISCGAVFMGANTYIGNGPNFMVKAIAEAQKVKMPSFFGYMAYSCGVLIPLFVIVGFLFFR